jgi:hypothetical protein
MNARWLIGLLFLVGGVGRAATGEIHLPAFPTPALVLNGAIPKEHSSLHLLRQLHRGGVHGSANLETLDADYALLRMDSLGALAGWLEAACLAVDVNVLQARSRAYDGTIFARLLGVATSLAALRENEFKLAIPVGVMICERKAVWGDLPGDGATDAYVVFATDGGILVYDPPTRQLANLSEFPNKARILRIRF